MNKGKFGFFALIGAVSAVITIFAFISGRSSLQEVLNWLSTPTQANNQSPQNDQPAGSLQSSEAQTHPGLSTEKLNDVLVEVAKADNIDRDLLASVMDVEGRADADEARRAGASLNELLLRYNENLQVALAAYKAGPDLVDKWHGVPPDEQTRVFVATVIREYNTLYSRRAEWQKQQSVNSVTSPSAPRQ